VRGRVRNNIKSLMWHAVGVSKLFGQNQTA
jgi:hypothetical protein